jgi:hypothetical protein
MTILKSSQLKSHAGRVLDKAIRTPQWAIFSRPPGLHWSVF